MREYLLESIGSRKLAFSFRFIVSLSYVISPNITPLILHPYQYFHVSHLRSRQVSCGDMMMESLGEDTPYPHCHRWMNRCSDRTITLSSQDHEVSICLEVLGDYLRMDSRFTVIYGSEVRNL